MRPPAVPAQTVQLQGYHPPANHAQLGSWGIDRQLIHDEFLLSLHCMNASATQSAQRKVDPHSTGEATRTFNLILIPHFKSEGAHDTLNHSNILNLMKHVPTLAHLTSSDLEWVTFKTDPAYGRREATLTGWKSTDHRNAILQAKAMFEEWGIELRKPQRPKYPHVLLPGASFQRPKSILWGTEQLLNQVSLGGTNTRKETSCGTLPAGEKCDH